jgi:hypothetical protein
MDELEAGLADVRLSPADSGVLAMIVRRPDIDAREVLDRGDLSLEEGLVGDTWITRGNRRTEDGSPHPDMQLNVINSRLAALIAGSMDRWSLAGDQLYVDLDLSDENLPAGTQVAIGECVIEVTDQPHTGCKKFSSRFGVDALRFVNSEIGKKLRLRGINAKVVVAGTIRSGDTVRRLP